MNVQAWISGHNPTTQAESSTSTWYAFAGQIIRPRTLPHSGGVFRVQATSYRYSGEVSRSESGVQRGCVNVRRRSVGFDFSPSAHRKPVRNPAELQALSRHCAANYISETWTCASALGGSYLGSGYSKQLDCDLEDDLAAGMSRHFTG
jgi:hypothetical protein